MRTQSTEVSLLGLEAWRRVASVGLEGPTHHVAALGHVFCSLKFTAVPLPLLELLLPTVAHKGQVDCAWGARWGGGFPPSAFPFLALIPRS